MTDVVQDEFGELRVRRSRGKRKAETKPAATAPVEASLPEGWEALSYASRRELMPGAMLPNRGGIVGSRLYPEPADMLTVEDERELFAALRGSR